MVRLLCAAALASTTRTPVSVATGAHKSERSPSLITAMCLLYSTLPMTTILALYFRVAGSSQFLIPNSILAFTTIALSGRLDSSTVVSMAVSNRRYSPSIASQALASPSELAGSQSLIT